MRTIIIWMAIYLLASLTVRNFLGRRAELVLDLCIHTLGYWGCLFILFVGTTTPWLFAFFVGTSFYLIIRDGDKLINYNENEKKE